MSPDLAGNVADQGRFPAGDFFSGLLRKHHTDADCLTFYGLFRDVAIPGAARRGIFGDREEAAFLRNAKKERTHTRPSALRQR